METEVVELGDSVRDRISGFSGVVTGLAHYISGCSQALIGPKLGPDGGFRDSHWFDVQRLQIDGKQTITLDNGDTPGCDKAAPKH